MIAWLWLVGAIGFEVLATLSLRASEGLRRKAWLAPIITGYGVSFFALAQALRAGMPVAVAYAIWAAVGVCAVALLARVFWGDPVTRRMLIGIGLIGIGIALMGAS